MTAGTRVDAEIHATQELLFRNGRRMWRSARRVNRRVKPRTLARWIAHSVPANSVEAVQFGWAEVAGECGLAMDDFRRESLALTHAATAAAVIATYGSAARLTAKVTRALTASAGGRWRWSRCERPARMERVRCYLSAFEGDDDALGPYAAVGYRFAAFCEASTAGLSEEARDTLALAGVDIYVSTYVVTMLSLDPFEVITRER